jgi:hypothetical protein
MRNTTERNGKGRDYYDQREERPPQRGNPYGNGQRRYEDDDRGGRRSDEAPAPRTGSNMDLSEWMVAHRVRVDHITVTIWQRRGARERPTYSLTLVRTFQTRSRGYLSTTKLFAEDAPLAAEAFRKAAEWLKQGAEEEPIPF